jgi:hypothetical protein
VDSIGADGAGAPSDAFPSSGTATDGGAPEAMVASMVDGSSRDGAGTETGTLLLVAAVAAGSVSQSTLGFSYDAATGAWSAGIALGDANNGGIDALHGSVALAFTDTNHALAVLTHATDPSGISGPLQYATWASGTWVPFASIGALSAASVPALAVANGTPELAFAADTGRAESVVTYARAAWSPAVKISGVIGGPPSVASRGADLSVAYVRSSDGALVTIDRTGGTWGTEQVIASGKGTVPPHAAIAPTLVSLTGSGPELIVVYTDSAARDYHFATRTGGKWSSVQNFNLGTKVINPDPASNGTDGPSPSFATPVIALPGGKAALAFTSVSQHVYTSEFDGATWSIPSSVFTPWCLDCIDVAQAGIAPGLGSATLEVVFGGDPTSSNAYVPYHTRRVAGQWTTPKAIVPSTAGLFATYQLAASGAAPADAALPDAGPGESGVAAAADGGSQDASNGGGPLAARPLMGWSSWSTFGEGVSESIVKGVADAVAAQLLPYGYAYIDIDDGWYSGFDTYGRRQPDPSKFPDGISGVAAYVHGKRLKLGVYLIPGLNDIVYANNSPIYGTTYHAKDIVSNPALSGNTDTASGQTAKQIDFTRPGAVEYIASYANLLASWGVDYVKMDFVGPGGGGGVADDRTDIEQWRAALDKTGRPMWLELSNKLAISAIATWRAYSNGWRIQTDVECYCTTLTNWAHVLRNITSVAPWVPYAGPGGWNDLDSMEIGNGAHDGTTADERQTMFSFWCLSAARLSATR